MITGHNTDVQYGDVVLHVQSYADLLENGKGDDEIMAFMDHQHRMMIKSIQNGKFDDKIRAFVPDKPKMEPVEARVDLTGESGRTLDQVILEYLTSEAEQEQLLLVLEEEVELKVGSAADLALRARSSKNGQPIAGASVTVKMISTFGGPRTLGLGETDGEGFLRVPIEIPSVDRGTAALIISASSDIGQAELKHLL